MQAVVGKMSFDAPKLTDNIQAFFDKVSSLKPARVKGTLREERTHQRDDEPQRAVGSVGESY